MRRRLSLYILICLHAFGPLAAFTQSAPLPGAASDIQELRRTLMEQLGRLDALEANGASVDPEEVASLKALLEETDRRISALEASQAATAATGPAAPPPSETQGKISPEAPAPLQAEASQGEPRTDKGESPWDSPTMPTFYGNLKPRFGVTSKGQSEVGQSTSRIGLKMSYPFAKEWSVFALYELGINMTKQNLVFVFPAHGPPQGQGKDPVYTRQGYGGVSTPWGSLSIGKMNSTYYDIAGWTDQFFTYGSDASGAFGVADGGVAGTGRASTALQYRFDRSWFHLGFQAQHRNTESDDLTWYNTVGGSLRFDLGKSWTLGAAYQEVRDGVPDPQGIQSKLGDKAFIAGFRFKNGPWYVAADYADTLQNQKDDKGVWFDAHGFELAIIYTLNERWGLQWGYDYLEPQARYNGFFRTEYGLFTVTYSPHKNITFSGEFRFDSSRNADGRRSFPQSVLVFGLDFGW